MKVILQRISLHAFAIVECPNEIKSMLFSGVVDVIKRESDTDIELIHPTWVREFEKYCKQNNIELEIR